MTVYDRPTVAENKAYEKHARQTTVFLTPDERVEDAFRAGFRAGRAFDEKKAKGKKKP